MEIDHRLEYQLGGEDVFENMELLDASANHSSGSKIRWEIEKRVSAATAPRSGADKGDKKVWDKQPELDQLIAEKWKIKFLSNSPDLAVGGDPNMHWEGKGITGGTHLEKLKVMSAAEIEQASLRGSPTELVVF